MNYIEQINGFWQKDTEFNFTDKEIALYFYLLKISNSIGWKNPFGLSNIKTIANFGWGKSSFDTAKNRLKIAGLIDFKPGDGRGNVYQYELKVIEKVGQKVPLSVALSDTLCRTLSGPEPDTSINKKENGKQKNSIGAVAPTVKKVFVKPSLEEVKAFFLSTIGNTQTHNCWPADRCNNEAGTMYDHYTANGWVQGRGKPIKDWQAACRNWIRNGLKGTFDYTGAKKTDQPAEKSAPVAQKPQLNKTQKEVNYFFDMYLEGKCTVISLDINHYDQMKADGLMKVIANQTEKINAKAIEFNPAAKTDEVKMLRLKKCFAVLELFELYKTENKPAVYVLS